MVTYVLFLDAGNLFAFVGKRKEKATAKKANSADPCRALNIDLRVTFLSAVLEELLRELPKTRGYSRGEKYVKSVPFCHTVMGWSSVYEQADRRTAR